MFEPILPTILDDNFQNDPYNVLKRILGKGHFKWTDLIEKRIKGSKRIPILKPTHEFDLLLISPSFIQKFMDGSARILRNSIERKYGLYSKNHKLASRV